MNYRAMAAVAAVMAAGSAFGADLQQDQLFKMRYGQAEFYLREFEREVELQRGGEKSVWRNKTTALEKIQALREQFPDRRETDVLFERARTALKKSKGDIQEVNPEWTDYLRHEEELRGIVWDIGKKEWEALLAAEGGGALDKLFPAPDPMEVPLDDLRGKKVVLDEVEYPAHQFYGVTGEFVFCGKPSEGFYFLDIARRDWLGPYEAVKRYRRQVDTGLEEVKKWTVLGEITDLTMENPRPNEDGTGNAHFGWVVKPIALMVPGHVVAFRDKDGPATGRFAGEERVDAIKDGWYTVKEIPGDVTPTRLMEIFMTAIKEKNFKLYLACIDPERQGGDYGADEVNNYHWDLHQGRFHGEYVHATFGEATIRVIKGFDEHNDLENYFLDEEEKEALRKAAGDLVEEAVVESRAIDANGKQLGTPHPHRLRRVNGGRWYVEDYAPRF